MILFKLRDNVTGTVDVNNLYPSAPTWVSGVFQGQAYGTTATYVFDLGTEFAQVEGVTLAIRFTTTGSGGTPATARTFSSPTNALRADGGGLNQMYFTATTTSFTIANNSGTSTIATFIPTDRFFIVEINANGVTGGTGSFGNPSILDLTAFNAK